MKTLINATVFTPKDAENLAKYINSNFPWRDQITLNISIQNAIRIEDESKKPSEPKMECPTQKEDEAESLDESTLEALEKFVHKCMKTKRYNLVNPLEKEK